MVTGNVITDHRPWVEAGILLDKETCTNVSQDNNIKKVASGREFTEI